MKTDYHFHPNLQAKNPEKRLRHIWDAITANRLDAIICTEHAYKNAPNAYRRLVAAKPENARTHIFPGAELITNEGKGIEIIAFAENDWYDNHPFSKRKNQIYNCHSYASELQLLFSIWQMVWKHL